MERDQEQLKRMEAVKAGKGEVMAEWPAFDLYAGEQVGREL